MRTDTLNSYEKGQICVLADKSLIRHPVWTAASDLQALPVLWLEVSEENKSLQTVTRIWDFLFEHAITRRGLLVCIGGGVLTDLGGFAASTYKRGMDYINIPTTLLAMIDASSGGKTGINYRGLKNSIGAFAPPKETIICPEWLTTLPPQQFLSGFGEMLKTGLIESTEHRAQSTDLLWNRLMQYDLDAMPVESLRPLIEQCLNVKNRIVTADPEEDGLRKALNFGHTFGHALEEISFVPCTSSLVPCPSSFVHRTLSLCPLLHGYAVVYGLIAELYLSVTKLGCSKEPLRQLTQLMLHYYGKPQCKCSDFDRLIALMQQDKKNERAAEINCTLIHAIGEPVVNQVITPAEAREALDYLFSL